MYDIRYTEGKFIKEFFLTDQSDKWPAHEKWSCIDGFLDLYGHVPLKVTEIHAIHGMGKPHDIRIPLKVYKEMSDSSEADYPFYCFEHDLTGIRKDFLTDYSVPKYFKGRLLLNTNDL